MELKTIINIETGKEIGATIDNNCLDTEILIDELRTEIMDNPYFDFTTRTFYNKK